MQLLDKFYKKQGLAWLFILGSIIAVYYSGLITLEKIELIKNVDHTPPCSIDAVISCGSVMVSPQASVFFGIPNPLFGIFGFALTGTIGAAILAGAKFKKWFWLALQVGMLLAVSFVYWLFHEAVYEIYALCLYCIYVWTVTIPMFLYLTIYNIREGHIKLKPTLSTFIQEWHFGILAVMYSIIIIAILVQFWDHWRTFFL